MTDSSPERDRQDRAAAPSYAQLKSQHHQPNSTRRILTGHALGLPT